MTRQVYADKPSIVVHGPQGCGKSRHAVSLLRFFGLRHLVDDWAPGDPVRPRNALILTNADPCQLPRLTAIEFKTALQLRAHQRRRKGK